MSFIFRGILGDICGTVTAYNGADKRLKIKGFEVSGGIRTLRGFAKMSDLAKASKIDANYQRDHLCHEGLQHIERIKNFLTTGKESAKFLPEIVLVSREKIALTQYVNAKNETIKGETQNLDYYSIYVKEESLYRIDGNHRLEAGKDLDLYVPFSIILWNADIEGTNDNYNQSDIDNEAFLFHFLNGKAKKLTSEENFKGLVKSTTWSDDELVSANPILPYLKIFHQTISDAHYFNGQLFEEPLSKMAEILSKIPLTELTQPLFKNYLKSLNNILTQNDRFNYLNQHFNDIMPQFIFYILHKTQESDSEVVKKIVKINNWAEKYKYEKGSFTCGCNLYDIASSQLDYNEIILFVAMPYYNEDLVKEYNHIFKDAVKELSEKLKFKLTLPPIMTSKGSAFDINQDILNKINDCDIFIADISESNPNVMYELGLAQSLKKKIILFRKEKDKNKTPFDIITQFHNLYKPEALRSTLGERFKDNVETILVKELGMVFDC